MQVRTLTNELQGKCEAELDEIPGRIPEDLKSLKKWILSQPHLNVRSDDQWLTSFLRSCKYRWERVKGKLDSYCTLKTLVTEFYSNRDPLSPEIQQILERGAILPLKHNKGPAGEYIIMIRGGQWKPDQVESAIKCFFMIQDILFNEDDNYVIAGQRVIVDIQDISLSHIMHMKPTLIHKSMKCLQESYSRIKGLHFINISKLYGILIKLIWPCLSKKMQARIAPYNSKNISELYKTIPQDILPEEYGGKGGSINEIAAEWKKKVENYRDWFAEDAKYGSNENKRPGSPKTVKSMFGCSVQ